MDKQEEKEGEKEGGDGEEEREDLFRGHSSKSVHSQQAQKQIYVLQDIYVYPVCTVGKSKNCPARAPSSCSFEASEAEKGHEFPRI